MIWHLFFGAFILVLAMGMRPSGRVAASLLSLPFLSVSLFAWLSSNPFNGAFFAAIGIYFLRKGIRLSRESVQIAPLWSFITGLLMFGFGWIYPHFLNTSSYLPYLYAAPIGIIPCPTLIIVIGLVLMLDSPGSEKSNLVLGVSGLLYGILGVAYLLITLDWVLILAVSIILSTFLLKKRKPFPGGSPLQYRDTRSDRLMRDCCYYTAWSDKQSPRKWTKSGRTEKASMADKEKSLANLKWDQSQRTSEEFEIIIKERLDDQRKSWFDGMTLHYVTYGEAGQECTVITGPVIDQPALHGLLERIRDLNLTLISVIKVYPKDHDSREQK